MNKIALVFIFLSLFLFAFPINQEKKLKKVTFAQSDEEKVEDLKKQIDEYEKKISEAQDRQKSLSSQIAYMDNQIKLTGLKIKETLQQIEKLEDEITSLSAKIERLENSLTSVSEILLNRIITTYKTGKIPTLYLLFSSERISDLVHRAKYLRMAQIHDKKLMIQMTVTKENFEAQKKLREEKKEQQEALKKTLKIQEKTLAQQKQEKEYLLEVTKNDEKRYQELLVQAKAELEAIQAIIAGKGEETEVGEVNEGSKIATIITGPSACSTGTHLHFEVVKNGSHQNPAGFLKPISLNYAYDTGKIPETMVPSGNWNWPLNEPIVVHQIYGETAWIKILNLWYKFHTGIDISSDDKVVKSVKQGKLFRGGIPCGGGILRYVKVVHADEDISTYYLHVNY